MPSKRPLRAALLLLTTLSGGCATGQPSAAPSVCPEPVIYSTQDQLRWADETEALPPGTMLGIISKDYITERDKLRACRKGM
jgi:hypothetical protein